MRLILDTNVVLSHPEILSLGGENVRFLLPRAVVRELSRRSVSGLVPKFSELIERASKSGRLRILPDPSGIEDIPLRKRLGLSDVMILESAIKYQKSHPDQRVFLVSDDIDMLSEAKNLGLQTATRNTIGNLLGGPSVGESSQAIAQAVRSINRYNRRYLIGGFLLGLAVATLLLVAWLLRERIGEQLPAWGLVVGAMFLGILLFWFRSRHRLSYGVLEIAFGLYTMGRVGIPQVYDSAFFIQIAAAVYIIVRGLDNIEKGVQGTKIGPFWARFFSS